MYSRSLYGAEAAGVTQFLAAHLLLAHFVGRPRTHCMSCSPAHSASTVVLGFLRSCRSRSQSLRTSASVAGQGHRTVGESLPAEVMFFTATMQCAAPRPVPLVCVSSLLTISTASTPDGPYIELHRSVPTHHKTSRAVLETCPVRPSYGRSTSRIGRSECLYEEIYLPFGSGAQETGCTSLHGRRGAAPARNHPQAVDQPFRRITFLPLTRYENSYSACP